MPGPRVWVPRDALGLTVYSHGSHSFLTHLMRIASGLYEFYCLTRGFVFSQVFVKTVSLLYNSVHVVNTSAHFKVVKMVNLMVCIFYHNKKVVSRTG